MKNIFLVALLIACCSASSQIPKWKMKDFDHYISEHKGKVLVINFWATFCKPCIAEIPGMIGAIKKYSADNVQIIFISVDEPAAYPSKLNNFLKTKNWKAPVAWLNESDADYFCPRVDKNWSGSIPATLILNTNTGYRAFYEEEFTAEKLDAAIKLAAF